MNTIHQAVIDAIGKDISLSHPPDPKMGDIAIGCFELAKAEGVSPAEAAIALASDIQSKAVTLFERVEAIGPYVNIQLNGQEVARLVLNSLNDSFGTHTIGDHKKILVEFGCPNPMKAFHLGHLKNLITGESVARVLENAGYQVVRVNYQGDVGMHVAKALWGIFDWKDAFDDVADKSTKEKAEFLGNAYAHGAAAYDQSDEKKAEVEAYNAKVYAHDASIQDVYDTARAWSLEYFDNIYKRFHTHFDTFYFESNMYERGLEIVQTYLKKGVFKESEGAVIFEGSKYGLHDRVFVNSKGLPTYEAKDVALAEQHLKEKPDKIIHVVGKEQTEYFKVVFRALEEIFPESKGKEFHLPGGFLQLKGNQKMSSRTGNIVTGDELVAMVEDQIARIMKDAETPVDQNVCEKVTVAALVYVMLKADVTRDVAFDLEESVSTSGDSGPYLLYIVARIKGILNKTQNEKIDGQYDIPDTVHAAEKSLLLQLSLYPSATQSAADQMDPSHVARYLFTLAQSFNSFYDACPVLKAEGDERAFRLALIGRVLQTMERGLHLLGIETVERM